MNEPATFALSKWYLDCVTDTGDAAIAYAAALQWRKVKLDYASVLLHQSGQTTVRTNWKGAAAPALIATDIHWTDERLQCGGLWQADAAPITQTLLQTEQGRIEWQCWQPRARVEIHQSAKPLLQGVGYVEHMRLTIAPWRLPIEQLRWGRFHAADTTLVWIEWRGPVPLNLVFDNGKQTEASISDDEIVFGRNAARLRFDNKRVLREGPLVKTALASLPGVRQLFPQRSLQLHECKWLSRATLERSGGERVQGWAIHEVVCL